MTVRLTAVSILLAVFGALLAFEDGEEAPLPPVPMAAEDGKTYLVEPGETLGSVMSSRAPLSLQEEEAGTCVPEPMEKKPEGAVACRCYEVTECKGNEARECKRHCRKDLCQCCDV